MDAPNELGKRAQGSSKSWPPGFACRLLVSSQSRDDSALDCQVVHLIGRSRLAYGDTPPTNGTVSEACGQSTVDKVLATQTDSGR